MKFLKTEMARLALVLFSITASVALLLSIVNAVTYDRIQLIAEETLNAAMNELVPDATSFTEEAISGDTSGIVTSLYVASKDGEDIGYCVIVSPNGFGGEMTIMVAVDTNDTLLGMTVTSHSETPGFGAKSTEPEFQSQFAGKVAPLTLASSSATLDTEVDAISGATVTSKAVILGVNAALDYVAAAK